MTAAPIFDPGLRQGDAAALAAALVQSRSDTLTTFELYVAALSERGMTVPCDAAFNPPLWELGHIGWFQDFWLGRFPPWRRGVDADPEAPRTLGERGNADALYHSGQVAHATRWHLPLPGAQRTREEIARTLERTLALLHEATPDDTGLYFHRLVLAHEDMHHEALLYMAQSLGIAVGDARWQAAPLAQEREQIACAAGVWRLGNEGPGFAFDNELCAHDVSVGECEIDSRVLRWADYLHFVDDGGYEAPRWWSPAGQAWLASRAAGRAGRGKLPRALRREGAAWQTFRHGRWQPLDEALPACHLTLFEAEAWCAWAGRRLPNEAEWERAAVQHADRFAWGAVWEWTSSPFQPYPGFEPHPYRDYSAPWFGTRQVLRGASFATQPRMRHARYRNYFSPERNDVFAGFRSCAR